MTEQQRTAEDPAEAGPDTAERDGAGDVGGPAAALGTGVEEALTGTEPREEDEGGASSSPQPNG